jgi:hypothetical protein
MGQTRSLGNGMSKKASVWTRCISGERISRKCEFLNYATVNEVFLDDFFQNIGSAGVIPDAFGINDGDGAAQADAEAVGFGAIDQRFGTGELEFLQACFEVIPRSQTGFFGTALWLGLISAKEDMAAIFTDAQSFGFAVQFRDHSGTVE